MKRPNLGQSTAEYFILMAVILAVVLATGFIDNVKGVFRSYFTKATDTITVNK